ncbi:F-box/RNI/FBD-like domain-containing protein [Cinnamomum micranthum f. kanehirae]|uniref:F-box/RNI/FBD-like domain-containing protein n=1 Tax=Cinnamomum micranthum f. kanehirae TaxID=337451 RepID=A0A3S3P8Y0_9MAGN|nr:F-box/RNI/FBD-like domain-containing protein [Cinnamomum micranthum f. kanehirae]
MGNSKFGIGFSDASKRFMMKRLGLAAKSAQSLKELGIWDCPVLFPSQFKVLTNLQNQKLIRVRISNRQLEILVSGCPNLEKLNLSDCPNLRDFQICAPNLLLLDIEMSEWTRFSLIDAPPLKHVTLSDLVDLSDDLDNSSREKEDEDDHLVKLLMNLSHIERFSIACYEEIFKYTSIEQLPDSLSTGHQLANLKELSIRLALSDVKMVSFLLFLLRSCPNLQQLALEDGSIGPGSPFETDYWEKQRHPKCLINHLTKIQIKNIGLGDRNVLDLMKFFWLNARVLIKMSITINCFRFDWALVKEITVKEFFPLKRASPHALIEIKPRGSYECYSFETYYASVGVVLFSLTKAREQGLTSIKLMYDAVDVINAIKGADDWFTSSYVLDILECA